MPFVLANRVRELTETTGTGTLNLDGAVSGFQTFFAGVGGGNTTYYCITDGNNWEVGLGTVNGGIPNTLTRDTVYASSAGGTSKVNWAAGTRQVFCGLPAEKTFVRELGFDGGNQANPGITFTGDLDTGVYSDGPNVIGLTTGGSKKLVASAAGLVNYAGVSGGQGALFELAPPASGTSLSGNIRIDFVANLLRIFETGGSNRGVYLDIGASAGGAATPVLTPNNYDTTLRELDHGAGNLIFTDATTAPNGTLKANGATVSRSTYARLFARIGTRYGVGDGSTTFQLPDWRGYFIRGLDDGRGVDSGRSIGTTQADDFKSHNHTRVISGVTAGLITLGNASGPMDGGASGGPQIGAMADTGGAETRPKNIALLACVTY